VCEATFVIFWNVFCVYDTNCEQTKRVTVINYQLALGRRARSREVAMKVYMNIADRLLTPLRCRVRSADN
jgi:hypothetical protein